LLSLYDFSAVFVDRKDDITTVSFVNAMQSVAFTMTTTAVVVTRDDLVAAAAAQNLALDKVSLDFSNFQTKV
jgi:hypothetical protein